jgi:hypothetical protein
VIDYDCSFIISAFPDSQEKQKDLLEKIKKIQDLGGTVTLMTHYNCPTDIKNTVDLYIYNSVNDLSYKDSDVLSPEVLEYTKNFSSLSWVTTEDNKTQTIYRDYKGWIGYTPSIVSLFLPSLSSSFSRSHEFAIYLESDFDFPENFDTKVNILCEEILESGKDALFYRVPDSYWVHGHLFLLKLTPELNLSIPWGNYSTNKKFLKTFPNFIFEDFLCCIENKTDSLIKSRSDLDNFFGGEIGSKWDTHKFQWKKSNYMLCSTTLCSPFVNINNPQDVRLFLTLKENSPFSKATFHVRVTGKSVYVDEEFEISRGGWLWKSFDFLNYNDEIHFEYNIHSLDNTSISIEDSYVIKKSQIEIFSRVRNFEIL